METQFNDRNDQGNQGGFKEGMNHAYDNWGSQDEMRDLRPEYTLPYDDPAVINPQELATFPKQVERDDHYHHHHEHESHLINKKVKPGTDNYITRTDNNPDKRGYM